MKKQKTAHSEDDATSTAGGVAVAGGGLTSTEDALPASTRDTTSMDVDKGVSASDNVKPPAVAPSKIYVSAVERGAVLDMTEEKYVKDVRPLLAGCTCHACRHHTRAYIHHLIRAKERLGEILLYAHNQHQLIRLFEVCREMKTNIHKATTTQEGMIEKDIEMIGNVDQGKGGEGVERDLNPINTRAFALWTESIIQQMH